MYILTLNFLNQALIISFYSEFLETWFHWNKSTFIDDFIINVIMQETFIFVNLKFHSFIEVIYSKVL
jgi:hypothetical protein